MMYRGPAQADEALNATGIVSWPTTDGEIGVAQAIMSRGLVARWKIWRQVVSEVAVGAKPVVRDDQARVPAKIGPRWWCSGDRGLLTIY